MGDNRQGKTQTLYIATAMLDDYGRKAYIQAWSKDQAPPLPKIDQYCQMIMKDNNISFDLPAYFKENIQQYLNSLASLAPKCANEIIGTKKGDYSSLQLTYELNADDITEAMSYLQSTKIEFRNPGLGITVVKNSEDCSLLIYKTEEFENNTLVSEIKRYLTEILLQEIHTSLHNKIIYYPSERIGISLILQTFTNLGLKVPQQNTKTNNTRLKSVINDVLSNISLPSIDYIGLIFTLLSQKDLDPLQSSRQKAQDYISYAELLSSKIIRENIYLSDYVPDVFKEILIEKNGKILDISATSSGVKGLMGLVLYLRYLALPRNYVVIDEPELNLHPNQQAAFVEFLTLLVNSGIHVAITTHSPYIVEHLENLILAHKIENPKDIVKNLYLQENESLIARENVGVYLFEDGNVKNILMEDGEIDWQTFCNTANTIQNLSSLIYDKLEEEHESVGVP